jgi:hypothetical protein
VRYLILALSSPGFQAFFATKSSLWLLMLFLFWFAVLVFIKIAVGLGLVRYAGKQSAQFPFFLELDGDGMLCGAP